MVQRVCTKRYDLSPQVRVRGGFLLANSPADMKLVFGCHHSCVRVISFRASLSGQTRSNDSREELSKLEINATGFVRSSFCFDNVRSISCDDHPLTLPAKQVEWKWEDGEPMSVSSDNADLMEDALLVAETSYFFHRSRPG